MIRFTKRAAADVTTPAANKVTFFIDDAGAVKTKNESGTVASVGGGVADDAWTPYTPTLTASSSNPTLGSGSSVEGGWTRIGRTIFGRAQIVFGTSGTAAGSGTYQISIPVAPEPSTSLALGRMVGHGYVFDSSTGNIRIVVCRVNTSGTHLEMIPEASATAITEAIPWAWAASDRFHVAFQYEADDVA